MSQDQIHRDSPDLVSELPAPPTWAVWVLQNVAHRKRVGKFSTCADFSKAKSKVARTYNTHGRWDASVGAYVFNKDPEATLSWRIYEWVDGGWVERYRGEAGDRKSNHPLFVRAKRVGRGKVKEEDVEKALASIMDAMSPS